MKCFILVSYQYSFLFIFRINNRFCCLQNAIIRPSYKRLDDPVKFLQNIYADFKATDSISENDDDNIDEWGAANPYQSNFESGSNKRRKKISTTSDEICTRVHRQRYRADSESSSENLNKILLTN